MKAVVIMFQLNGWPIETYRLNFLLTLSYILKTKQNKNVLFGVSISVIHLEDISICQFAKYLLS